MLRLPIESKFDYSSNPEVREVLNDHSQRKAPAIVKEDWMSEESELRHQMDDFQNEPHVSLDHRCSTPETPAPSKRRPHNAEDSAQSILPFSIDEIERIKEAVKLMQAHGVPI